MRYDIICPNHGLIEIERDMKDAPKDLTACPHDGYLSKRVYGVPLHAEDRRHHGDRNPWNYSIGAPAPQSRAEMRRLEKEKGIYFDRSLTPREKVLVDYAKHVESGGERLPSEVVNPTVIENKPLSYYMDKRGYSKDK